MPKCWSILASILMCVGDAASVGAATVLGAPSTMCMSDGEILLCMSSIPVCVCVLVCSWHMQWRVLHSVLPVSVLELLLMLLMVLVL